MKLSIITINYNNMQGLQKTIQSVIKQSYSDYEYIIIDGGSSDESVGVIKDFEYNISYWVSENDKGIYHAMNKGILKSKGEYILMLNSGDYLKSPDILMKVFGKYEHGEDILYGQIHWQKDNEFYYESNYPVKLNIEYFFSKSIGHQASFIKRSVHEIVGFYDESLKICSDWKLFILALQKYNLHFKPIPLIISAGDVNGISWHPSYTRTIQKEIKNTIKQHFPKELKNYKTFKKKNNPSFINRLRLLKHSILKN